MTFLDTPCPCGSAHQLIADVQGRLDDVFTYPGGQVEVRLVDQLERQATGKVRRFLPLAPAAASLSA